jgi:hypothetical protein
VIFDSRGNSTSLQKCSDIRVGWWGVDHRSRFGERFWLLSGLDLVFQEEDGILGGFDCKVGALVALAAAFDTARKAHLRLAFAVAFFPSALDAGVVHGVAQCWR